MKGTAIAQGHLNLKAFRALNNVVISTPHIHKISVHLLNSKQYCLPAKNFGNHEENNVQAIIGIPMQSNFNDVQRVPEKFVHL